MPIRIEGHPRDLGGFHVRRLLPALARRLVGPFIFFDHMGPAVFTPSSGIDVRPHPHIGLATITYLFEGAILHRDSLGSERVIRPGDVNWMLAGRGIAHSERTPHEERERGGKLHGLQTWVALPLAAEEDEPRFDHHPHSELPVIERGGAKLVVIAGTAYGERAPVRVLSPTLYVHARLEPGASLDVTDEHEERAVYVSAGAARFEGELLREGTMLVLDPGARVAVQAAETHADVILIGGAPLDGARHIFWNFVASSKERIERAKREWKEDRFPRVVGDELERISLPD
jgi:redox-sensitive bicupin YhaK (pirin superfamily)